MFIGQYYHRLEEKGRLSVPKKFRHELGDEVVLSEGLDGCLFLYSTGQWNELLTQISNLPLTKSDARGFLRSMSFGAVETEIDRLGRILVPDHLKTYAGIESECVVAGAVKRIEIWSKAKFDQYVGRVHKEVELMAEKLEIPNL